MDKPQVFIDITQAEIADRAAQYCERGWRFANLCASTVENGVEMLYSFSSERELENLRFVTDLTTPLASVSNCFPNAFFFENEAHELFGVPIADISIDFKGAFYAVSVPTPMNPGAVTGVGDAPAQAVLASTAAGPVFDSPPATAVISEEEI